MKKVILISYLILAFCISISYAITNVIATKEDVARLKEDFLSGKVQIGKTRLKEIRDNYGDAPIIRDTSMSLSYDFGDVKMDFDKSKYWKSWEYDSSKPAAYTDDIDDLRYDLESKELVGENITFDYVTKEYGDPTESQETNADRALSIYYYGNIKMVFENVITVRSLRVSNIGGNDESALTTSSEKK